MMTNTGVKNHFGNIQSMIGTKKFVTALQKLKSTVRRTSVTKQQKDYGKLSKF